MQTVAGMAEALAVTVLAGAGAAAAPAANHWF